VNGEILFSGVPRISVFNWVPKLKWTSTSMILVITLYEKHAWFNTIRLVAIGFSRIADSLYGAFWRCSRVRLQLCIAERLDRVEYCIVDTGHSAQYSHLVFHRNRVPIFYQFQDNITYSADCVYSGKGNATAWCPSVCLSVPSAYWPLLTSGYHATRPAYILARQ